MNITSLISSLNPFSDKVVSFSETYWKNQLKKNGKFAYISHDQLQWFTQLLRAENDPDSYLTSPVYYAFTGRRGLWIYQHGNSFIPLCWHPNIEGKILVFPMRGENDATLMGQMLAEIPEPPAGICVARVKRSDNDQLTAACENVWARPLQLVTVTETVLDWKYPVRILSSETVSQLAGSAFRHVRNHVKQIIQCNTCIEPLSADHIPALEKFVYNWAKHKSSSIGELNQLLSPYYQMLALVKHQSVDIHGFVVSIDDKIEAFTAWDVSNDAEPVANRHVNLCNINRHGMADFMTWQMASFVNAQGIRYMNVGGSETAGLDQFKSKFMPAFSLELCSVEVLLEAELRDAAPYSAA